MTEQATTTAVGRRIPPADTKSVTRLADSSSAHVPHPDDAVTRATDTSTARLGKETTRRYRGNTVPTGQLMVTRGAACDVAHFCKVRALIPPSLQHTHTAAHVLANAPPAPRVTSTTTRTPSLAPASEPAAAAAHDSVKPVAAKPASHRLTHQSASRTRRSPPPPCPEFRECPASRPAPR